MDGFQFDHVGVAIVTAFVMFVTWYVTQYLNSKTTISKSTQTINKTGMKKVAEPQTKKVAETQTNKVIAVEETQAREVTTNCAQTETMRFTEGLTNYGDKKVDLREKFDKFCEICEANIGNEAVGFCKICEKFMCLNCCKHHEKIPLSQSHMLLGKEEFTEVRNKKKLFEKSFVLFDNYCFHECDLNKNHTECWKYDHNIQLLCLAQNLDDMWNSIGCFAKLYKGSQIVYTHKLMLLWQDNKSREIKERSILSESYIPGGICTFKNASQKSFGWYFTIPDQQKIYKYAEYADQTDVEILRTCGRCYGIAVFNEGLAISLNIPTKYSLPEWQVQFISYDGTVRKQICLDDEGVPLFQEPKHLSSNDAEDILFVSDQGNHSIIALDTKGYTLFKYTHDSIKNPRGITCDDEGNIYVASENKVVQIDQHGTKSRVILNTKEKQSNLVIDVCYNKFTSELGVLSQSSEVTFLKPLP